MTPLFIYGTLKRGGSNHSHLQGSFAGTARTVPGYALFRLEGYPGMVPYGDDTRGVAGEVWWVNADALAHLDAFEGVDEGLYTRGRVALQEPFSTLEVQTYFFAGTVMGRERLGDKWVEQ